MTTNYSQKYNEKLRKEVYETYQHFSEEKKKGAKRPEKDIKILLKKKKKHHYHHE